jgi:hypothetical protein
MAKTRTKSVRNNISYLYLNLIDSESLGAQPGTGQTYRQMASPVSEAHDIAPHKHLRMSFTSSALRLWQPADK